MTGTLADKCAKEFKEKFERFPDVIVFAPGRINLIGEHTDYNQGLVLPAAVQYGIYMAIGNTSPGLETWSALDRQQDFVPLQQALSNETIDWPHFIKGAREILDARFNSHLVFNCVFNSDLPEGAGMSSSSALTCATILALNNLYTLGMSAEEIAVAAHDVEHDYIGLKGGVLDQFACMLSSAGAFVLIDCRTRRWHVVNYNPEDFRLCLLHSNVSRRLANSRYNTRAEECSKAVSILQTVADVKSLSEVSTELLEEHRSKLGSTLAKRVQFVIEENARVLEAKDYLQTGNQQALGEVLLRGHAGLRDLYEVSVPETDFLVDHVTSSGMALGARQMGGGFGGCTLNLFTKEPDLSFMQELNQAYKKRFGLEATLIEVVPSGSAKVIQHFKP